MIVDELLDLITKQRVHLEDLKLSRVCIGICYTAVMIKNGYVGLCYTPMEDIGHPARKPKRHFHGAKSLKMAQLAKSFNMIERAVGVATLNALSQYVMDLEDRERQFGVDVSDAIEIEKDDSVAVVGYIRPLVEKLRAKTREVHVFERNPQLRGDALPDTFVDSILPKADIVVISGASLVNGTLDRLLELSKGAKFVTVAGPTASVLPEPLFERSVNLVAGVRAKGSRVLEAVAEGKAFRGFKELVEKYVIWKDQKNTHASRYSTKIAAAKTVDHIPSFTKAV